MISHTNASYTDFIRQYGRIIVFVRQNMWKNPTNNLAELVHKCKDKTNTCKKDNQTKDNQQFNHRLQVVDEILNLQFFTKLFI